jgi:hypothetical protein
MKVNAQPEKTQSADSQNQNAQFSNFSIAQMQ